MRIIEGNSFDGAEEEGISVQSVTFLRWPLLTGLTIADNNGGILLNGLMRNLQCQIVGDQHGGKSFLFLLRLHILQKQAHVVPRPVCEFLGIAMMAVSWSNMLSQFRILKAISQ